MKIDFQKHFSLNDYQVLVDHYRTRPADGAPSQDQSKWRERYHELLEGRIGKALIAALGELKASGGFAKVANSEGYSTFFSHAWNSIAENGKDFIEEPDSQWRNAIGNLPHLLAFTDLYRMFKNGAPSAEDVGAAYGRLVDAAGKGDFEWWELIEDHTCAVTGKRLKFEFKGWTPQAGYIDAKHEFVPAEPPVPPCVQELALEFPSGEVLASDWFRIDAFTKAVDGKHHKFSVNTVAGREAQTRHYAEVHGFVSVCVDNTSPGLFRDGSAVVVGHWDEYGFDSEVGAAPETAMAHEGRISTELWWATLIDKQVLVDLVARQEGTETARATVDRYVEAKRNSGDILEFKVEPGTHYLYFHGETDDFSKAFGAAYEFDPARFKGIEQPLFVLSRDRLAPKARPGVEPDLDDVGPAP